MAPERRDAPAYIGWSAPICAGAISRKRGIVLHISEAYEHEPILPYQAEDSCQPSGCNKIGTQSVDVAAPLTLTPIATVGTATITCQGSPSAVCVTDAEGTSCTVTMTQRLCVAVPIRYSVAVSPDDPTIACADGAECGGSCSCCM